MHGRTNIGNDGSTMFVSFGNDLPERVHHERMSVLSLISSRILTLTWLEDEAYSLIACVWVSGGGAHGNEHLVINSSVLSAITSLGWMPRSGGRWVDGPSSLEEMPVHWSCGSVECRRVDHCDTSYKFSFDDLWMAKDGFSLPCRAAVIAISGNRYLISYHARVRIIRLGWLWTHNVVADPKTDLSEWCGERGKCSSSRECIGLLPPRQLSYLDDWQR